MNDAPSASVSSASGETKRRAVLIVRTGKRGEVVRRRLAELARTFEVAEPEALNRFDTRVVFAGPELEPRIWRLARTLREQVVAETEVRIVCFLQQSDARPGDVPPVVNQLLWGAPPNTISALAPFADGLPFADWGGAQEWRLREPRGERALVFPGEDVVPRDDSIFGGEALSEVNRFMLREGASEELEAFLDSVGFLDIGKIRVSSVVPVTDVARHRRVFIVAPPWTGKTHVAKALRESLQRRGDTLVHLSNLEDLDQTLARVPTVLGEGAPETRLFWLIDAVDEALHRGGAETLGLLRDRVDEIERAHPERLHLVLLARDDDTKSRVERFFGEELKESLSVFRLLPVDREEAARALARPLDSGSARLQRALERLADAGLEEWSTHIPILERAAEANESLKIDDVLQSLCVEPGTRERDLPTQELVTVASRMAATMLVCRLADLPDDKQASSGLAALMSTERDKRAFSELRSTGPLLLRTPDGYRFRQEHAKELLAAGALKDLRRSALHRFMTHDGRLRRDLREVANQLERVERRWTPLLKGWREATPTPWSPAEAKRRIDEAEQLFRAPTWAGLRAPEPKRFLHPDTKDYLRRRVESHDTPAAAKAFFLDIAERNRWHEFVPSALEIARDSTAPSHVRQEAVSLLVAVKADRMQRQRLRPVLRETSPDGASLRAQILLWMLQEDDLNALEVAEQMPLPERSMADYRSILVSVVEERLTEDHARIILDAANTSDASRLRPEVARLFVGMCVQRLILLEEPTADDRERVVRHLFSDTRPDSEKLSLLRERQRSRPELRRAYYLQFRGAANPFVRAVARPEPEDATWLLDNLSFEHAPRDLLALTPLVAPELRERIEGRIRETYPELYATWRGKLAEQAAIEAEVNADHASIDAELAAHRQRQFPRLWLQDIVEKLVASDDRAEERLHSLAYHCFGRQSPVDVDGSFTALPFALQRRAIEHTRKLLSIASVTPLPGQPGGYASAIGIEGDAFRAAVTRDGPVWRLPSELIDRWLPSALFAGDGERVELVERCMARDAARAAAAVLFTLEAEAKTREFSVFVSQLPGALWQRDDLHKGARALVERKELSPAYRGRLLHVLAKHAWSSELAALVKRHARWKESPLRAAAVSCLLAHEPVEAAKLLDPEWSDEVVAEVLVPLDPWTRDKTERAPSLPDDAVISLLEKLAGRKLPSLSSVVRILGPGDRLRRIRDRLEQRLDEMTGRADYGEILERLGRVNPELAASREMARVSLQIEEVFREPSFEPSSIGEFVAALDGARATSFRDEHDLAELVLECLDAIGEKSKEDAASLKPDEGALQVYVARLLSLLLPQYAPNRVTVTKREPKEGREIPDILVTGLQGQQAIELPIEVKWSHNKDLVASLTKQLGMRYLVRSHRTRGVYLVGFSGVARNKDRERLEHRLKSEASAFMEQHPDVTLDIYVLDLLRVPVSEQMKRAPAKRGKASTKLSDRKRARPKRKAAAKTTGQKSTPPRSRGRTTPAGAKRGTGGSRRP